MSLHRPQESKLRFNVSCFVGKSEKLHLNSLGELFNSKTVPFTCTRIECDLPSFRHVGALMLKACLPLPFLASSKSDLKMPARVVAKNTSPSYTSTSTD